MIFQYDFTLNIIQYFAILSRVSGFLMALPFYRTSAMPRWYKMILPLGITIILLPIIPASWEINTATNLHSILQLMMFLLNDLLLGGVVGLIVALAFEVVSLGSDMISLNLGFSMARQIDPTSGANSTVFSVLLTQMFLILFLIFNVHHDIIRLLSYSFEQIPPGAFEYNGEILTSIIDLSSQIFTIALKMALPILALIMFLNVALALISRFGEDFNVLMLSFPLRLGIGLLISIALLPTFSYLFREINEKLIQTLSGIL